MAAEFKEIEWGVHMRRIEFKTCKKCGKPYVWTSGGIVATPADYMDHGMCDACRLKLSGKMMKKVIDIIRGKEGNG